MNPLYFKPGWVVDEVFQDIFSHLTNLDWLQSTEARKEYFMALQPQEYTYGTGKGVRTYNSNPFTGPVRLLLSFVNDKLRAEKLVDCDWNLMNVCFLNRYDSKDNQLGWHADNFSGQSEEAPIAVLSFGAEREIWWKPKDYKGQIPPENRQLLEFGSLFVMPKGFQELYYHKIPKSDRFCGMRISLTFRCFQ